MKNELPNRSKLRGIPHEGIKQSGQEIKDELRKEEFEAEKRKWKE
jgi:hypothetical protein